MSDSDRRAKWRAKTDAATKGPWRIFKCQGTTTWIERLGLKDVRYWFDTKVEADASFVAMAREAMPELLDDVEQLRKDDRRWREMLWYHHGCPSQTLYGDDGELQCNNLSCMIDFKRMSPAEIQDNWCRRGNKLIAAAGGMEEIIRQVREQNKRDKE